MESSASMFSSRRSKILLATFTALCIVGVAVCVIVVALPSSSSKNTDESVIERAFSSELHKQDLAQDKDMKYALNSSEVKLPQKTKILRRASKKLIRKARSTDYTSNSGSMTVGGEDTASCISSCSNNTIPAAHIHGHGLRAFLASTSRSSIIRKGFQQKWRCNGYLDRLGVHAFVDGGMIFNQTDKSLRVPVCGYYHVISQILFDIDDEVMEPTSVYHLLKFQSNCSTTKDPKLYVTGWSMVAEGGGRVTTHTSDVFHLCAGGKIWVEIPDGRNRNPCCPKGNQDGTFISAYMISPTTCDWPPNIINHSFKK